MVYISTLLFLVALSHNAVLHGPAYGLQSVAADLALAIEIQLLIGSDWTAGSILRIVDARREKRFLFFIGLLAIASLLEGFFLGLSNKEISCIAVGRHPKQLLKRIRLLKDTINVRIDKACLRIRRFFSEHNKNDCQRRQIY